MKILGLGHYSRTGKDTLANYLVERGGGRIKKLPFAWKLKEVCQQLYGWDGLQGPEFYDTEEGAKYRDIPLPTIGKTPVEIWVGVGHGLREHVYAETWINYVLRSSHDCDLLIVPDVRYPNEVQAIRELGGTVVKVMRPGTYPRDTVADQALVGFENWDYLVSCTDADGLREWSLDLYVHLFHGDPIKQTEADRKNTLRLENNDDLSGTGHSQRELAL